jgi:SPX domain protein involved in polyphosphate accumulation
MQNNGVSETAILANVSQSIRHRLESPKTAPEVPNESELATGSQRIIEHMSATLDEVHTYAFEKLTELENKIVALKQSIVAQKNRSQQEAQIYIETVDAALRTSEDLDRLVDDLERALPKETKKTNGNGKLSVDT